MNRGKTSVLAASVLLLTSIAAHATTTAGTSASVHHRHHAHSQAQASRASLSLDEPGLRSSRPVAGWCLGTSFRRSGGLRLVPKAIVKRPEIDSGAPARLDQTGRDGTRVQARFSTKNRRS